MEPRGALESSKRPDRTSPATRKNAPDVLHPQRLHNEVGPAAEVRPDLRCSLPRAVPDFLRRASSAVNERKIRQPGEQQGRFSP